MNLFSYRLDIKNEKILEILDTLKNRKAQKIFITNKYNSEIFQTVLQIYLTNTNKTINDIAFYNLTGNEESIWKNGICMRFLVIVLLCLFFYFINKNNNIFKKFIIE